MDMRDEWTAALIQWASKNRSVRELWLFGSRAIDRSTPDSDVDIAISLMAARGEHDWALGNYMALGDKWQRELAAAIGRHVSLEAIIPGTAPDTLVRSQGRLLWSRGTS